MTLVAQTCPECRKRHYGRGYSWPPPDNVCDECHQAKDPAELISTGGIRCPMCRNFQVDDLGEIGAYREGTLEVSCDSCGHDYEVEVHVEWTWHSPEIIEVVCGGSPPCEGDSGSLDFPDFNPRIEPEHRFECVDCKRICCACFGAATDEDDAAGPGKGICCDCQTKREETNERETV